MGVFLSMTSGGTLMQYVAVAAQLVIYVFMYKYWKHNYDTEGVKQKVISQSDLPMHKRETLVSSGSWGFLLLIYFVSQAMSVQMITPVYYVSTILDFVLMFFTLYPLVIESNIGLKKLGITKMIVYAIITVVVSITFNAAYNTLVETLNLAPGAGEVSVNQVAVVEMVMNDPIRSFLMITFSAAIVEEWLFRGLGFRTMFHRNRIVAYVVTFVAFSTPHLLLGLAESAIEVQQGLATSINLSEFIFMPVYGMMGVFFAYSYAKTESIYTPMLAHFFNNTFSFLAILLSTIV